MIRIWLYLHKIKQVCCIENKVNSRRSEGEISLRICIYSLWFSNLKKGIKMMHLIIYQQLCFLMHQNSNYGGKEFLILLFLITSDTRISSQMSHDWHATELLLKCHVVQPVRGCQEVSGQCSSEERSPSKEWQCFEHSLIKKKKE